MITTKPDNILITDFPSEQASWEYYATLIKKTRENTPYRVRKEQKKQRAPFFRQFVSKI
jgi:hypothetical protein